MELELATITAVTEALGLTHFDLLGWSLGAAVAAQWAADRPAAVSRLVLYGGWATGTAIGDEDSRRHIVGLLATHWGLGSDLLTDLFAADADAGTRQAFAQYQRVASSVLWLLCAAGWVLAIMSTFAVDHLDLIGLRQAGWTAPRGTDPTTSRPVGGLQVRGLHGVVRHPLMTGLVLAFWATPQMGASHLLFAVAASGYIAVGIAFEERDLRRTFGSSYDEYAARVPALVPRLPFRRSAVPTEHVAADDPGDAESSAGEGTRCRWKGARAHRDEVSRPSRWWALRHRQSGSGQGRVGAA